MFFNQSLSLPVSFDFKIYATDISMLSSIVPQNEDAYNYCVENDFTVMNDGSVPFFTENVGDFISDAGHSHLCCELV